ncbi:MAG: CYTH domain-containing protein [Alphaproteobacteria bacterium]|nr:CYTH domain-containing protein [Alphaproteobacteria bacterium]
MTKSIEIEKKFRVVDGNLDAVVGRLTKGSDTRVVDQYYDTLDGHYYQQGIFIRLRNNRSLDIKFNPQHLNMDASQTQFDHIFCHEYNFAVPFATTSIDTFHTLQEYIDIKEPTPYTFEQFLNANQLAPLVCLDKKRTSYVTDTLLLAIDKFEEFGTFIEFEAKKGFEHMKDFLAVVESMTKNVNLEPFNSGYVELALRKTNEVLYNKGKYLLTEEFLTSRSAA